jgi:iron complex outermembrane receptor protein
MDVTMTARPAGAVWNGRNRMRLMMGTMMAGLSMAMPSAQAQTAQQPAQAGTEQRMSFDIPAQDLSRAVLALASRASLQILFDGNRLQTLRSKAVSGSMTPREALARMLDGTGMTYRFTGPATVTLVELPKTGAASVIPLTAHGQGSAVETATSPVDGYVATRSAAGSKTDTPLIETPQSISVIPRDQIADQNAQTLNQTLRYTAGVTPETRGAVATRYDMFTVRGFDAQRFWNGLKQQGLYYIEPQLDPYLMERIEVLKGPSSTLYGQAPAGGIANQVSKRPTETSLHEIGIEGGSNNHARLTGDFSGKVDPEGKLLYRFTGVGVSEDGQINMTENERLALAPSLTWRPDDDTSLTLIGLIQTDPKGNSYGGIPPQGTVLPNPFGTIPVDFYDGDPNYEKFVRQQQALGYEFDRYINETWSFRSNGRVHHTTLAYDSIYANGLQSDNQTLNRGTASSRESLMSYVLDNQVETRFGTGAVNHTLVTGFDYQHMNGSYATGFGSAPTLNVFNPVYYQSITAPARSRKEIRGEQTGVYTQDHMRFGGFNLTLGLRHDSSQIDSTDENGKIVRQDDKAWTGKAGLMYNFANGMAPYVSYSEAFTPQSGTTFGGEPFKPEDAEQYEVGLKYQPPGTRSLYTLAAFEVTRTNVKTGDPEHTNYSIQTGEVRSRGVEMEARFGVTDQLDLIGAYTLLDTEVTKDTVNQGKRVAAVPEHLASAWAMYRMPEASSYRGLSLGAGVRYTGDTVNTSNKIGVPSFTLVDAMASYDLGALSKDFAGMEFTLNVKNLFDKTYVASCYYGESWCAYGYERTITAGLRYRW